MNSEIIPCTREHIEALIEGADAFLVAYGLQVVEGFLPFDGALQYTLDQMNHTQIWQPWVPYLFVFPPDRALVGFGGFKAVPDADRTVEIGYSIAPSYQNRGIATRAARQLIDIAFTSGQVDCVCAHTLAASSASTQVLKKCGMSHVSDLVDPEDGNLWRWEVSK